MYLPELEYTGHIQDKGWVLPVKDGNILGTVGEFLRLEAIKACVKSPEDMHIEIESYLEGEGWQGVATENEVSGTIGQARRIEAFRARLVGVDAYKYSVWYGTQAENNGWLGFVRDWEPSGTTGGCLRIEALKMLILPKSVILTSSTNDTFLEYIQQVPQQNPVITSSIGLRYFGDNEFKCACGCGLDVADEVKIKIDNVRHEYGYPLFVSSGARCFYQNALDGGIPNSNHVKRLAVDVFAPGRMSRDEVDVLAGVIKNNGLGVIKYHDNLFDHADGADTDADWSMN